MRLDLARWQFAFTTINHFFFIPITIGLAFLTALLQTAWHRNHQDEYLRLTRFFGTLLVINVAIGVVTGIVQEFEFGMNWGAYSRLVGNIFGAPLAMEGLAAFEMLADGASTGQISAALLCSDPTSKRRLRVLFAKMEVNGRTQAVAEAMRRGLI